MENSNDDDARITKFLIKYVFVSFITLVIATIVFYPIKGLMIEYGQSYILINSLMALNQMTFIISLCVGFICGLFSLHYLLKLRRIILIKLEEYRIRKKKMEKQKW